MARPSKTDRYREVLRKTAPEHRQRYLRENSHLPGPRGNLELVWAAAEELSPSEIHQCAASGDEFLTVCGAVGLGRLCAEGDDDAERLLHDLAADSRWRVREGAAMALQRLGDTDREAMLGLAEAWTRDSSLLVRRAAVAGVCEPRLLDASWIVSRVLAMLDAATSSIAEADGARRRTEEFRVLRQALGYCWSVAVAAAPDSAFSRFEDCARSADADVRWIVRQNLKKARLIRAGPDRARTLAHLLED